ncbi:hypothetical protein E4T56_gene7440 [Termitomyces sp. T112]|nr:hypothetical protein E4T56_gene7440 [Termitomyces sp. T112]
MFQAKPTTFQLESSRVAFATLYLQGITFNHYTTLLQFDPNNSVLSNWLAFTQEFSSKFGIFNTVAKMEENLFNLWMHNNEHFMTFIIQFEQEAYETSWNYNALQSALHRALPQWIKDILRLTPKQITYDEYKALVTQVDQCYWEDCSENMAPQTAWNTSVPFDVSPSSKNSKTTIDHPWTPLQLHSRSAWSFVINVQLNGLPKVLPALIDSGASGTFVSSQLDLQHNNLNKPLKLQLFDGSPAMTGITQYHNNTLTLDNDLQFQAQLLITQLLLLTLIVLGLLWLQDINPDIDWKNLTIQFPGPEASLAAAIPLCLQPILDSDISDSGANTSRATQSPSTSNGDPEGEESATPPRQQCSTPPTNSATTPDSTAIALSSTSIDSGSLDIKIISAIPFTHLLQDGTPAFQLQVMPALPKEHLCGEIAALESKMEEQILSEVVPPEYHEFADVFSEGSAKELPPHCSYNHKIDLEEGTSSPFGKIYNIFEIKLWALKEYLDNMLSKGFICSSISAASTPVLFAKKKDGSLQLCVDYWELNKVTKKNWYPLPLIRDLVDHLHSAKIYTKIDLHSGYNNVQIALGHEWKTTFCTHYGLFEYLVMPFGMTNSPATFQYFMNDIFHNMNDVFIIVYLDNDEPQLSLSTIFWHFGLSSS